jgi:CBS-domain-containing membrane protein
MKRTVGVVMTRTVVTVNEAARFKDIVSLLARHGVSALPVLDLGGRVIGVVSEADLMLKEERLVPERSHLFEGRERRLEHEKMEGRTAADLMTAPAVTVHPEASVPEAARLMHLRRVKRLPVVGADGRLVGIVSRRDVIAVFLRPDPEIRDEVVQRVIRDVLWIDPSTVRVKVRDGLVMLEGQVERRSLIAIVADLVEAVEGVVGVDVRLSFRFDDTSLRPEVAEAWGVLPYGLRVP